MSPEQTREILLDQISWAVGRIVFIGVVTTNHDGGKKPTISCTASLSDLGLDELSVFEILMRIEEIFCIELSDDDVTLSSTINEITKLVARHVINDEQQNAGAIDAAIDAVAEWSYFTGE